MKRYTITLLAVLTVAVLAGPAFAGDDGAYPPEAAEICNPEVCVLIIGTDWGDFEYESDEEGFGVEGEADGAAAGTAAPTVTVNGSAVSDVRAFQTDGGSTSLEFTPPADLEPGSTVDVEIQGTDSQGEPREMRRSVLIQDEDATGSGAAGGAGSDGTGSSVAAGEDAAAPQAATPVSARNAATGVAATLLLLVLGGAMLVAARARNQPTS